MAANNLWGDLSDLESVRTPKGILKEQSEYLTEAMGGFLLGRIIALQTAGSEFIYDLDVVVPALNRYVYTVLSIRHTVELYPVELSAEKPPINVTCENEKDFVEAVSSVLSSAQVKAVLSSLHAQANE